MPDKRRERQRRYPGSRERRRRADHRGAGRGRIVRLHGPGAFASIARVRTLQVRVEHHEGSDEDRQRGHECAVQAQSSRIIRSLGQGRLLSAPLLGTVLCPARASSRFLPRRGTEPRVNREETRGRDSFGRFHHCLRGHSATMPAEPIGDCAAYGHSPESHIPTAPR